MRVEKKGSAASILMDVLSREDAKTVRKTNRAIQEYAECMKRIESIDDPRIKRYLLKIVLDDHTKRFEEKENISTFVTTLTINVFKTMYRRSLNEIG